MIPVLIVAAVCFAAGALTAYTLCRHERDPLAEHRALLEALERADRAVIPPSVPAWSAPPVVSLGDVVRAGMELAPPKERA